MVGVGNSTRGMRGVRRSARIVAASVALALIPVGAIVAAPADAQPVAHATSYPSWADVQQAQQAENATKALVAQIQAQLAQLQAASQAAQADRLLSAWAERAAASQADAESKLTALQASLIEDVPPGYRPRRPPEPKI